MIFLYSGTPGSGKSLHTAVDIMRKLRRKHNVIANFPINLNIVKSTFLSHIFGERLHRRIGQFIYKDNFELTVNFLVKYARDNHKVGKEGQTLLIIDECSVIFNAREYSRKDRMQWIKFFQHHRKLGYNIMLVAQNDRLIDRQIRVFIEYDVRHRCANNFGTIGLFFTLFQVRLFCAVTYWYGLRERCSSEFFTYRKVYSKLYDSFEVFDTSLSSSFEFGEVSISKKDLDLTNSGTDLDCGAC